MAIVDRGALTIKLLSCPPTTDELFAAALTVCEHATSNEDARALLRAIGITLEELTAVSDMQLTAQEWQQRREWHPQTGGHSHQSRLQQQRTRQRGGHIF